eukprot:1665982-Amphidinium_carterae.1
MVSLTVVKAKIVVLVVDTNSRQDQVFCCDSVEQLVYICHCGSHLKEPFICNVPVSLLMKKKPSSSYKRRGDRASNKLPTTKTCAWSRSHVHHVVPLVPKFGVKIACVSYKALGHVVLA